eukprot:GHVO01044564.1.p1 GENE.GHVO01044564.1~~GHVO01044564.1.p1  ORF type:complete len:122 (+),score=16.71 GHVO01044564.1:25-366(+)
MSKSEIQKHRAICSSVKAEGFMEYRTPLGTVIYSPQYSDEVAVYRHISVPRKMFKAVNQILATKPKKERSLSYDEIVDKLHMHMSSDWQHYLTHDRDMTLCFKRARRDEGHEK